MKFTQAQVDAHQAKIIATAKRGLPEKATLAQLIEAYTQTGSIWVAASRFGMCGQSVYERLSRAGIVKAIKPEFTSEQKEEIKAVYQAGFLSGDGTLQSLAKKFGKSQANICRFARKNGLTNNSRKFSPQFSKAMGERVSRQWQNGDHPRGMLGKKHTPETIQRISEIQAGRIKSPESVLKMMRTRVAKYGTTSLKKPHGSWKASWVEVGGQRFYARSRWEANYARYLEFLKSAGELTSWEHEPDTFWFEEVKRGTCSYLPDFKVITTTGAVEYHEVKGWMDARSKTKIKRMAKYHPTVNLIVRDSSWYRANQRKLKSIVKGWE